MGEQNRWKTGKGPGNTLKRRYIAGRKRRTNTEDTVRVFLNRHFANHSIKTTYFFPDFFLTLPSHAPTMQPESSDGFASVGTILPEENPLPFLADFLQHPRRKQAHG
jgi:hypothetical protein